MANSTLEILINAKDNASGAMKNVAASASAMGNQVEAASKKMETAGTRARSFEQAASKIDSVGRNARVGLSSMAQAADLVGVNLNGIIGPAASAADAIGDIVGTLGSLGLAAGVAGAAIVAIGLIATQLQKQHDAAAKAIAINNEYLWSLQGIAQQSPAVAEGIKRVADQMITLQELASANQLERMFAGFTIAKAQIDDFFKSLDEGLIRFRSFPEILAENTAKLDAMAFGMKSGYDEVERLRGAMDNLIVTTNDASEAAARHATELDYEAAAARRAAAAMGDTRGDAIKDFREGARSVAEMNTKAWFAKYEFKEGAGWVEKIDKNAQKASASVSQMVSRLKSMVEGALSPTSVEQRMGMAGDAWDEFRLRLEAVASGTDPAQYGEKFAQMFNDLGMSAQAAAEGFKNFSLFADPKNLKLVDFGPIIADVKTQLDGMIGKANLTAEAMKQVWANLSPQQKAALAQQGIEGTADAVQALLDPAGLATDQVKELGGAISAIPKSITSTFYVVKDAAETAVKEFRAVLDQFIADYGNVTISINAETSTTAPGTTPTAPAPTLPVEREKLANGGSFIVPSRYGYEGFNMGGVATASAGERVTVTPRGQSGGQFVFNVSVNNDAMLNALMRRVRALAMLNAV